ncbi:MAG: hypothetical protein ACKVQC_02470 [Elusimicrobiota bacterium]
MNLDKSCQYVFRIGSDNQHRIFWTGSTWRYEFLAGGVLFDELTVAEEEELENAVGVHGLTVSEFKKEISGVADAYSEEIKRKIKEAEVLGLNPCPKHGLTAKNPDDTCEGCANDKYPDDFKGTEG